jgi:hypothetical protein
MPDPASQHSPRHAGSSEPAAPLPRRVQGATDGPQPAPRLVRPEFSVEFLARVRAGIQAEAAKSEEEPGPGAPLPHRGPGGNSAPAPQGPATRPALPLRPPEPGTAGGSPTERGGLFRPTEGNATGTASFWDAGGGAAGVAGADGGTGSAAGVGDDSAGTTAASPVDQAPGAAANGSTGRQAGPPIGGMDNGGLAARAPGPAGLRAQPAAGSAGSGGPAVPVAGPAGQRASQPGTRWRLQPGLGLRIAGLAALVIVVLGALAVLLRPSAGQPGDSSGTGPAVAARNSAAAWVAAQVTRGTVVSCDPVMCRALAAHRMPAADLRTLRPGSASPLTAQVIVVTPVLRSEFGHRIGSGYAPELIARFGSGNQRVEVRAVGVAGAARYRAELAADRAARRRSGAELARNPRLTMPGAARRQLAAGQVDPRVMTAVAGLAAQHHLRIVMFADSGPGVAGAPLRSVELAAGNQQRQRLMLAVLRREAPRLRPEHIVTMRLRGGRPALLAQFGAPSPLGLLGR